jgi:hypothetical protein
MKKFLFFLIILFGFSKIVLCNGFGAVGDDLGSHIATQNLNMSSASIVQAKNIIVIGTDTYSVPYTLVTNSVRNLLTGMPQGAGIINADSGVADIYNGSAWKVQSAKNIVYVNDITDLPNNNILEAGKTYDFTEVVLVSSIPFTLSGVGACNMRGGFIVYTGTGAAIRLNAQSVQTHRLTQMAVQCINPLGEIFDITATGNGIGSVFGLDIFGAVSFDGINHAAKSIGTIKNVTLALTQNQYLDVDEGLTLNDLPASVINSLRIDLSTNTTGTLLSIDGTNIGSLSINNYFPIINTGQKGIYFSSTTVYTGVSYTGGSVLYEGTATRDDIFADNSFNQASLGFKFSANVDIPDSTAEIKLSLTDNLTVTTFTAVNVPELVSGTWSFSSERFVGTNKGRATFTGLENTKIQVLANPTAVTGIGTNKDISFYFVHGNETEHAITAFADAGGGQVTVTSANHGLSNGDRVVIKNTTNYNGTFVATNTAVNTFEITDTFVSTETGDWAVILEDSIAQNQLASTTKASNTSVFTLLEFTTNDYIELFIENNTDGLSLRVKNANIILIKS